MERIVVACTERQPAEACDKAVSLILTDPRLGQRSSYQKCSECEKWFVVDNLEFEFGCTLAKATDSPPTVECELRTRYPTFICRGCIPCGGDEHKLAEGQDDLPGDGLMQLSPDHTEAVYRLRSNDGTKNLVDLQKTFTFTCPKCGQESPEPLRTPQEVQHYIQQHMAKRRTGTKRCRLQESIAQGHYNTPAVYGSEDMNSSPVEVQVITWMSRLLVVVALHILSKTRSSSNASSDQQLYLPWRSWAVSSLTEDTQLIAAANWIRPSLTGLSKSPWHNLLDMILAPPFIAAAEQDAGMTAHKLAVLLNCKAKQLQQQQQTGDGKLAATAQGVRAFLNSMLSEDALFKHLPAEERVQVFLAMASIKTEEVAAALALNFVQDTYLKVCPRCGLVKRRPLGCSYCIISLKCSACRAAAADDDQQQKTLAAKLCPWCQDHADAAAPCASDWRQTLMTDEEFSSLGIPDATAEQRDYFTKGHKIRKPWKIDQWLPSGFIVLLVKRYRNLPKSVRSRRVYIAPNGDRLESSAQMSAWVQTNTAAAAATAAAAVAAQVEVQGAPAGTSAAAAAAGPPPGHAGGHSVEHIDLTASPRSDTIHEDSGDNVNGAQPPQPTSCEQDSMSAPATASAELSQQASVAATQLPAATAAVTNGAGATAPSPPTANEDAAHLQNIPYTSAAAAAAQQQTGQVSADAGCVEEITALKHNRLKRSSSGEAAVTPHAAAAGPVATVKTEQDNVAVNGAKQQHKKPRTAVRDAMPAVPNNAAAVVAGTSAAVAGGAQSPAAAASVKTETGCVELHVAAAVATDVPGVAAAAASIPLPAAATPSQPSATAAATEPAEALPTAAAAATCAAVVDGGVPHATADAAAIAGATSATSAQPPAIATAAAAQPLPPAAAAATSIGITTDIICKRNALVKSIDHVLFRTLLSVRSLRSSQATNTLYNTRLQLKQLAATEPDEAMLGLEVMHQFVSCLAAAKLCDDVFLMPGVQQLLDKCLLQAMREQCVPRIQHLLVKSWLRIVPKQCSSATAAGSATVLDMLLFCWSTEYQATQCRSSDGTAPSAAVSAEAAVGLCPVTLQVMLKAWKLAAAAAAAPAAAPTIRYDEQSITSVSQLGLQLVQGLCKLLLSCPENPPDMQNSAGHLAASSVDTIQQRSLLWQYAMELCLDVVNTVPDIAAEVAKVFKDWEA